MSDRGHPVVARLYDPVMALPERTVLVDYREFLVSGLSGRVLDLGAGTGALFPYFDRLEAPDLHVTAVEPDPNMRARARKRASGLDVDIDVVDADGEALLYDDGRSTLSSPRSCSVRFQTTNVPSTKSLACSKTAGSSGSSNTFAGMGLLVEPTTCWPPAGTPLQAAVTSTDEPTACFWRTTVFGHRSTNNSRDSPRSCFPSSAGDSRESGVLSSHVSGRRSPNSHNSYVHLCPTMLNNGQ